MCQGEDADAAFSAMYSKYKFAFCCGVGSKFGRVTFEGVTIVGDAIGECSISFSKGTPFSFAVLARCLNFLGIVSVVSMLRRLSPRCEGIPAGGPMSPGVKNSDEEMPAGGPMYPGV